MTLTCYKCIVHRLVPAYWMDGCVQMYLSIYNIFLYIIFMCACMRVCVCVCGKCWRAQVLTVCDNVTLQIYNTVMWLMINNQRHFKLNKKKKKEQKKMKSKQNQERKKLKQNNYYY